MKFAIVSLLAAFACLGTARAVRAGTLNIRPIILADGITATGSLTVDASGSVTNWNLKVTTVQQLAHFTPANTPVKNVSGVRVSGNGQSMTVDTYSDPSAGDGGSLGFQAANPFADIAVTLADFTGAYYPGTAMYMNGSAFDFLDLNQPANSSYTVATAAHGGAAFDLTPLAFGGGVSLYGTIRTHGSTGLLTPGDLVSWDIFVAETTVDVFDPSNSFLSSGLTALAANGQALAVNNPEGYLAFDKAWGGGHRYALQLADFTSSSPAGGQAGYFQGRQAVYTVDLHAPSGAWQVTGTDPIGAVPEPSSWLLLLSGAGLGFVAVRPKAKVAHRTPAAHQKA